MARNSRLSVWVETETRNSSHSHLRANGAQNVSQALYTNALNFDRLLALGST
jgi:hypothetical protein